MYKNERLPHGLCTPYSAESDGYPMPVRNVVAYLAVLFIFASPDHTRRLGAQEQGPAPGAAQPSSTPVFRGSIEAATPGNTGRIPGGTVLTPTTRRDFSRQDVVRVYTELYDDKASPTDFAGHAELRDATGNVVLMKPLERVPGESGILEGYRMQVSLPLEGVARGTYALQVHGRSGDDKDRRGTRSLLIRVK